MIRRNDRETDYYRAPIYTEPIVDNSMTLDEIMEQINQNAIDNYNKI